MITTSVNISSLASGKKVIISGGGTGGHIFPAIAIANALKKLDASVEILFVGAKGKMEMQKVPEAGYPIIGITIAGFNRSQLLKNWRLPFQLIQGFWEVRKIFQQFRPQAVIGVGGYASFPLIRYAQFKGVASFIHESNSFAGKANILLGKKARAIFVATAGMETFFPAEKLVVTGNPVRQEIEYPAHSREQALAHFGITASLPVVLVMGGSLGARSINEAIAAQLATLQQRVQLIWQTGKQDSAKYAELATSYKTVVVSEFIQRMDLCYLAANFVVSRSGAMSVAEICMSAKPAILVPYPLAAEDHQTANARYLSHHGAAWLIQDAKAATDLVPAILQLAEDKAEQEKMGMAAQTLAVHDAGKKIAQYILKS
jgi:UDP-N-acetylglucosamine--N-acetylmuramyl-(pentapeptide) pyrophosphoryl-undecaprenol N-acetylglucosamine transferase